MAPNLLLQKFPAPEFVVTASLRFAPRVDGETAGLIVFGQDYAWIGLQHTPDGPRLVVRCVKDARNVTDGAALDAAHRAALDAAPTGSPTPLIRRGRSKTDPLVTPDPSAASATPVLLRVTVSASGRCRFSASLDGRTFTPLGDEFVARPGMWVGAKVGLFAAAPPGAPASGHADWDWFRVETRHGRD